MGNKKRKFKSHRIAIFGEKFCLPKGTRKIINKANPELRGKKFDAKHLQKVINVIIKNKKRIIFINNLQNKWNIANFHQ